MARRNSFPRIQEQSHRISWKFLETPLFAARSVASSGRYSSACFTIISSISYDGIIQPPSGRMSLGTTRSDNLPLFERRIISPQSPRLHKQIHAALPSPLSLLYRTTEAPERSNAVVLPASDQLSRPGPAFGGREGVFRTPFSGEYFALNDDPLSENLLVSSVPSGTTRSNNLPLLEQRIISPQSPSLHKQIHAALPSPGRLLYRTTEAPERSDAVVLQASDQLSRPGPAFGGREGVFRTPFSGEYFALNDDPLPENLLVSSVPSGTTRSNNLPLFERRIISPPPPRLHKQIHAALPSPGRLLYRTTEAPERSNAVVLQASDQLSRPSPAFGGREGVFRTPFSARRIPKIKLQGAALWGCTNCRRRTILLNVKCKCKCTT
ncbi:uncharacterized protein LOC131690080 [Topomyia yanbarensis]|uniref:uncharacterized protein LOC131690080 n=1 Tax=Topomyia yanbarensis TaxID=2498891 RepID=UPI00273C8E2D|nr:uncharacterized protein LOC131690080 [Topomyia yanbarensis]